MEITNDQLQNLISCKKRIIKPPRKEMQAVGVNRRNDFSAICDETGEEFTVFIRQSSILPENFSIGLSWQNKNISSSIILFRCNGLHGGNKNIAYHNAQHLHYLNIELARKDEFRENNAIITDEYTTLSGALYYFANKCGIIDMQKYFPEMLTIPLFTEE